MISQYNARAWYWIGQPAGQSASVIFSSASQSLVPATDPAYVAWLAAGYLPTPWPKDETGAVTTLALDEVLAPYGLSTGLTAPTQAQLVAALIAAASAASASIVSQVFPDAAHQAAFQNAASIVNGNGGQAPTTGPLAAAFGALATAYGATPANFVAFVLAAQAASLTLGAASATLTSAASAATTSAQLATALTAFETAIGTVVAELNAALPTPITAPAAISIKGVNA